MKIFESSKFDDSMGLTEILVQFPNPLTPNKYNKCRVVIWSEPIPNLFDFFEIDDYIIIKGILSLKENYDFLSKNKECEFSINNFYIYVLEDEYI